MVQGFRQAWTMVLEVGPSGGLQGFGGVHQQDPEPVQNRDSDAF
jgi:hypothetical protein